MSPIALGFFFILLTIIIILVISIVYSNTNRLPPPPSTSPVTIVTTIGDQCNATTLLCDITQSLQCVQMNAPNTLTTCQVGIGGKCTNSTDCSIYPTVNGAPPPNNVCSGGGSVQMTCAPTATSGGNNVCVVASGNACADPNNIPTNITQCAAGTTCNSSGEGTVCYNCS